MTSIPSVILELPARSDALQARLIDWAHQNSGSDHAAGLAAMLERLQEAFAVLPGEVEAVPLVGTTARALRVRVRPTAPLQLCLSGHYDTVYSADHPFQRCAPRTGDWLNGPGVADMKGGLVTMLATLETFERTPLAARVGYEVILSPDEETGTHGTAPVLAEAARRHHFGLVFEPARPDGSMVRTRMGTGSIIVRCHGRSAHAAKAEGGRNAIAALAEFLVAAHRIPQELPGVLVNIGSIRGGSAATNIVPDFAEAELDVRIGQKEQAAALLQRVEELARPINAREGYRLELVPSFNRPPKGTGPVEAAAFAAWQAAARDLGQPTFGWVDTGGGSDGNLLYAAGLPNLDGIGPIGDHLHSDRECVEVPSIVRRAQLAALVLHRLAAGQVQLPLRETTVHCPA